MKRKASIPGTARVPLRDVVSVLDQIAPPRLAQEWDNVGLLAGDPSQNVSRALLSIDLTPDVLAETIRRKCELLVVYHPPIFKPVRGLIRRGGEMESLVYDCVRQGIAIYSPHTALDAAQGGTNDVLAELCGISEAAPLEFVADPFRKECKVVTFVPAEQVGAVAERMFAAGAGHIGDYSHCSFQLAGEGTFRGGETTHPKVGQRGRLERVPEIRLEMVAPQERLPDVIEALLKSHPYEEPAYDVYPLQGKPVRGIGRVGRVPRTRLGDLAIKLRQSTGAASLQVVGREGEWIERAIIVAGSAGSLPFRIPLGRGDVVVTGELRHHDALAIARRECSTIVLGHWVSERPVLEAVRKRLAQRLPELSATVSRADRDPFQALPR